MNLAPLAFAALALALASPLAAAQAQAPSPTENKHLIDRTIVSVPRALGAYTLKGTQYDARQLTYGVGTEWQLPGVPDTLRLDIFVYPIGRAPEAEVVRQEAQNVIDAIRAQDIYSDVVIGERTPFRVVRPEPSALREEGEVPAPFDPTPKSEERVQVAADADPVVKALADSWRSPNSHGLRQGIRFTRDGVAYRSLAYVFHRHLFGFKVRVSVPAADMEAARFEAVADAAVRHLVPQIDVMNFGSCGNIVLASESSNEEAAVGLVRGMARITDENCASAQGEVSLERSDAEQIEIVYPPGTWSAN